MTTFTDIANRALQVPGTRTTVTALELANNSTNEAIQINLAYNAVRKRLIRMAPWNCVLKTANLVYITSLPGTPENSATTFVGKPWQSGIPSPPWVYEYQYPVDCVYAAWIPPVDQIGFGVGIPAGPPVKFTVQTDTFRPVTGVAIAAGGTGHAVGDIITLPGTIQGNAPIGAPAQIQVDTVAAGVITAASVVNQVMGSATPKGGSYFTTQTNPVAQDTTTGSGIDASFNLTYDPASPQRVILTDQQYATLVYCADVTDPDIMDDSFQEALVKILGATITIPLAGDKTLAKMAIEEANRMIEEAREGDGNEGLTINDVTPDWIRVRGVDYPDIYTQSQWGFSWGPLWPIL
jgi:hypothetical protein